MAYKNTHNSFGFADLAICKTLKNNRSLETMEKLNSSLNWNKIESVLLGHYKPGSCSEGASAYHPLLLYKCLLLQKWYKIKSDPELETQINDRLSFKRFLRLSLETPSPDHSTFSRFRRRLSKEAMDQINSEILRQFEKQGLIINEGIAIDARLVKSASSPLSKDQIKEAKKQRQTSGNLDKKGKPSKFLRDLESDWTIKNDKPHYGLKEHASVDVNHGFVLSTALTPASVSDTSYLPYCSLFSKHTKQPIKKVYADKGYAGKPNRTFLSINEISDGIMRKNSTTAKLTPAEKERNKKISKSRYIVEQYFGVSHLNDRADRARFTTIVKNNFDCWMRQAAYNIQKGVKILSRQVF